MIMRHLVVPFLRRSISAAACRCRTPGHSVVAGALRASGMRLACLALAGLASVNAVGQELRANLWEGVKTAVIGTDKQADGGRCIIANLTKPAGDAFAALTPPLQPGVYDAVVHLKVSLINNLNTAPLKWSITVEESGAGCRNFDILGIEQAGVYQSMPCRFTVNQAGRAQVTLAWRRESIRKDGIGVNLRVEKKDVPAAPDMAAPGSKKDDPGDKEMDLDAQLENEPPLEAVHYLNMAVDKVMIVPVGDVAVTRLEVDKVRYKPGEQAAVGITVRNYATTARSFKVETVLVSELDSEIPVDARELKLAGGAEQALTCTGPAFAAKWGYAVRCRVTENGRSVAMREEYFTVHNNMWAVVIAGRGPAQFTAHVTRENATASALDNQRRYRNWVESGFWAPDEFGDFTPDTEHWWGGQGCYYGSVTGTKMEIEEGHKRGISFAVYSNIWGGDGPPAFEMVRAHPDWGYAAGYDVEWFERWDRNTMGTGKGGRGMHVWPFTCINYQTEEPFKHHGRELVAAYKTLGWDAVRYDSHSISAENARVVDIVKKTVRAELPEYQFGYNSSVPMGVPDLIAPFKAQCEGEGLIMEEGIREFGGGGMSTPNARTYADFAKRLLDFKEEARRYGGHFIAIGLDTCYPNDLLYQYIFWFAGNTHLCYDWPATSVADYAQFATRFAGLLWDLRVTTVNKPLDWVDFGAAKDFLWLPERHVHQRDLGGGRRQLMVHLINAPTETRLSTNDDCKVPPPREKVTISVKLPAGAKVRSAWCLTAEPQLTQLKLEPVVAGGRVSLTAPRLRFWDVLVLDLDNAPAFE